MEARIVALTVCVAAAGRAAADVAQVVCSRDARGGRDRAGLLPEGSPMMALRGCSRRDLSGAGFGREVPDPAPSAC